jgi:8-oxo-dGTP diphosphatase
MRYVVGFLFDPKLYNVVLIKKNKPEWQKGKLNGVGGKIEAGETCLEAMIREFYEETGLLIKDWTYMGVINGNESEIHFYYSISEQYNEVKTVEAETVVVYPVCAVVEHIVCLIFHG